MDQYQSLYVSMEKIGNNIECKKYIYIYKSNISINYSSY